MIKNDQMRGTVYTDFVGREVSYRTMSAEITNGLKKTVSIQIFFANEYDQNSIDLFSIPGNMSMDSQLTPVENHLSPELMDIYDKEFKSPTLIEKELKPGDTYTVKVGSFLKPAYSDSGGSPRMEFYLEKKPDSFSIPDVLNKKNENPVVALLILKLIWEDPFHPGKEARIINIPCGKITSKNE